MNDDEEKEENTVDFNDASLSSNSPGVVSTTQETPGSLLDTVLGVSLERTWFGVTRSADDAEKIKMLKPELVSGDDAVNLKMVRLVKKIIDTDHPRYKALAKAYSRLRSHWVDSTTPWVEKGKRVLKKSNQLTFQAGYDDLHAQFLETRALFCDYWPEIIEASRQKLRGVFDPSHYPAELPPKTFSVALFYPSLAADENLKALDPATYEKMKILAEERMKKACSLAETAFAEALQELIARVVHALTPTPDDAGILTIKRLPTRALEAFIDFYDDFKKLRVTDHTELDALVQKALALAGAKDAGELKSSLPAAQSVKEQFESLASTVHLLTGAKPPVRKITKSKKKIEKEEASA